MTLYSTFFFFFFNDTPTTEIYTLSLHDALPIYISDRLRQGTQYEPIIRAKFREAGIPEDMYYLALIESGYSFDAYSRAAARSEEHTSELQSQSNLVCRLLLEKKKNKY